MQKLHHWLRMNIENLILDISSISVVLECSCDCLDICALTLHVNLIVQLGICYFQNI